MIKTVSVSTFNTGESGSEDGDGKSVNCFVLPGMLSFFDNATGSAGLMRSESSQQYNSNDSAMKVL